MTPGRVIRDLAVMLADGGDCRRDLRAVRDQGALFGRVASDSTAFRVIDKIASPPACSTPWIRCGGELQGRLRLSSDARLLR